MKIKPCSLTILLPLIAGLYPIAVAGATAYTIATNPAVIAYGTGLAFDGTNYLVLALTGTNASAVTNLNVQLVSPSGALIGAPIYIGGGANLQMGAGLCFANTNYLVAWSDNNITSGANIFGQLISRTGAPVGSPFPLLSPQDYSDKGYGIQTGKALATDGTNILAVWQDQNDYSVYGQLVTPAGTLSGPEFLINSSPRGEASIAVVFGKTNYLAIAQNSTAGSENSNQVYGAFISVNGAVGTGFQISQTGSTDQSFLAAAFDGTNFLVVWPWDPGPETGMNVTNWQFRARLVSQAGTLPGSEIHLITNGNPVAPALAFDGTCYLLAYGSDSNTTNADRNLRCQFLDRSANLAGPLFTPLATQGTNIPLFAIHGLLFDGNRFALAATLGALGVNGEIFAAAIPASTAPPALTPHGPLSGTQFPLQLLGTPGINYAIQAATSLPEANWMPLVTNSPTNGAFTFTDVWTTNQNRFYRAVKQ
jgi:hypothetical protein